MVTTVDNLNPANHMHDAVLSMPSVYQLLPVPSDLFPAGRSYPAPWNLYDASTWGIDGLPQANLDGALQFQRSLAGHAQPVEQIMIAGCNIPTITVANRVPGPDGKPQFVFPTALSGPDSGDGTVPLWSSTSDPALKVYYVQCVHRDLPNHDDVIAAVQHLILTDTCDLPTAIPAPQPTSIFGEVAVDLEDLKNKILGGTAGPAELGKLSLL
jgi:hypothetical protein